MSNVPIEIEIPGWLKLRHTLFGADTTARWTDLDGSHIRSNMYDLFWIAPSFLSPSLSSIIQCVPWKLIGFAALATLAYKPTERTRTMQASVASEQREYKCGDVAIPGNTLTHISTSFALLELLATLLLN